MTGPFGAAPNTQIGLQAELATVALCRKERPMMTTFVKYVCEHGYNSLPPFTALMLVGFPSSNATQGRSTPKRTLGLELLPSSLFVGATVAT